MTFMLALLSRFRNGHWLSRVRALRNSFDYSRCWDIDSTGMCTYRPLNPRRNATRMNIVQRLRWAIGASEWARPIQSANAVSPQHGSTPEGSANT